MKSSQKLRRTLTVAVLLALFLILAVLNVGLGSVRVPVAEIGRILFTGGGSETERNIVWQIRLPRMLAAILLGGALSLSGFLLQTFFGNPIAGPYVLGISSGAKLAVAVAMIVFLGGRGTASSLLMIAAAFLGAMLSMGFVLLAARRIRRMSMLIVTGVMIGYICSAVTDILVTFADDANIVNLHNWSRGSFSSVSWGDVRVMTAVVLTAAALVFLLSKPIGAYQLGESYAQNMGVNILAFRAALILLSSVLSACVTAFAGPISFVGIAVPHIVKRMLHSARPLLVIPVCFLGGAVFCLGCDLLARTLFAPTELSISSVTAVFGVPVVIGMMLRKNEGD